MASVTTTNSGDLKKNNNTTDPSLGVPSFSKTLFFVEPLDGKPVDNKDLFIYANLTASRKARTILQLTNESSPNIRAASTSQTEINLIGYRQGQGETGSRIMTTDWSSKPTLGKVTDLDPNNTQNTFEGFGLESIDINITAMNPPTVTIKFIDTRGGGLFDQETFNENVAPINAFQNDNSPYNIFFELPPPLFYLTLKGYYGNPVTLCLYLIKWDGTFNSETGNFEITANFLGYTFAFLQDVRLGHLIGAGNTKKGEDKLKQVSERPTEEGYIFPSITLDDLSLKFQRITTLREETQKRANEFGKLRVINEQIKYIKLFRSYLGYFATKQKNIVLEGAYLDTNQLKPNIQQMFFRDVGIISAQAGENYNNIGKIIDNGLKKYEEFKLGNTADFVLDGDLTKNDIQFETNFENVKETRTNIQDTLVLVNKLVQENEPDANIREITLQDFSGRTQGKWSPNSGFKIINLRATRQNIDQKLLILEQFKKTEEEKIQNEFNKNVEKELGFTPNIRNIIGILCNNIEMFLSLVYDVASDAQKKGTARYANLGGYLTDSPPTSSGDQIVYPFPKVVDDEYREIYLGEIPIIEQNLFPEIGFIDELCTGLVYSIKEARDYQQSVLASKTIAKVDSFPINVSDIGVNPYTGLDSLNMEADGSLNKTFSEKIIERIFLGNSVSNYGSNGNVNINKIANLEAINFYTTLSNQTYKDLFNNVTAKQLFDIAVNNSFIIKVGGTTGGTKYNFYKSYELDFEIDNNGSTNSGNRVWNKILNLKEQIADEFKTNVDVKTFTSTKNGTQYVKRFFDTNTCYVNKTYLTLDTFIDDAVKNSIKGTGTLDTANLFENYTLDKLRTIPGFFEVPITAGATVNNTPTIDPAKAITQSSIYKNSNDYGKAYLILSSFNFKDHEVLYNEMDNDYSKIIRLPWFYILWLGANGYRNFNGAEILAFDSEFPTKPRTEYYYISKKESKNINNNVLNFVLQDFFTEWVQSKEFNDLKTELENIFNIPNLNEKDKKTYTDSVNSIIFKEYDILVLDPNYTLYGDTDISLDEQVILEYLNTFIQKYKSVYKPNTATTNEEESKRSTNIVNDNDIKGGFYIDLKHIYDNWIAGNKSDVIYSCCKTTNKRSDGQKLKLFDLFKFVDKFRNPVAGDAIININSFNDLTTKKDLGMYSFISKVLTDSYFMHFNLPIYIEFNKSTEVQSIFEPQTNFNKLIASPNFLCVYNGPPSSRLNSGSNYTNDSFKFNVPGGVPPSVYGVQGEKDTNNKSAYLVAFNVNYGSQSQSIFKNVTVSTQESKTTGEYITLLSDYVTGTGAAKPLLKDNSIFTLQRNRSYTSTIQMMGDMMIQPQMYFQLNNIPFFSGSYMIMNVSHSVKANNMTTTFKGVRQNNSPVKIVKEVTSFLNFQFDQGVSSGFSFTQGIILTSTSETTSSAPADLPKKSIENYKPTVGKLILKTFTLAPLEHKGLDLEVDTSISPIQSANKNGTVFFNAKGVDYANTPQPELNYTYQVVSNGDGWEGRVYNNNELVYTKNYPKQFTYNGITDPQQSVLQKLAYDGENFGFVDYIKGITLPSMKSFRESGQTTYNANPIKETISKGVLIVKHDLEDDGYTYFTGYYGLYDNTFNDGDTVSPKRVIGKPSKFKSTSNNTTNLGTVSTLSNASTVEKYYYHYEVRRTKNPETVIKYSDYLALPAISIPVDIPIGLLDTNLHDNTIY